MSAFRELGGLNWRKPTGLDDEGGICDYLETHFIRMEVGFYLEEFKKVKVTKHKLTFKNVEMKRQRWHYSSRDKSGESEERSTILEKECSFCKGETIRKQGELMDQSPRER